MKLLFTLMLISSITLTNPTDLAEESLNSVLSLANSNFAEVLKANPYVVVRFTTQDCPDCDVFSSDYIQLANKHNKQGSIIVFAEFNVSASGQDLPEIQIDSFPSLIFFHKGKGMNYLGKMSIYEIKRWVFHKYMEAQPVAPKVNEDNKEEEKNESKLTEKSITDQTEDTEKDASKSSQINEKNSTELSEIETDYETVNGVVILTDENFEKFIKRNPMVFVRFSATESEACKASQEDYFKLAQKYNQKRPKVVIADLETTVHKIITQKLSIHEVPSFKFYCNGELNEYRGSRKTSAIEHWIQTKLADSLPKIITLEKFEEVSKSKLAVILYGKNMSKPFLRALKLLAGNHEDVEFYTTELPEAKALASVDKNYHFMVFKNFADGLQILSSNGELSGVEMKDFYEKHRFDIVAPYSELITNMIFNDQKETLIFFSDSENSEEEQAFRTIAMTKKYPFIFTKASITQLPGQEIAKFLSIYETDEKSVVLVRPENPNIQKFKLEEVTTLSLRKFIRKFLKNQLKTYYKTEKPILNDTGLIKSITGATFYKSVVESNEYVFLHVYSPVSYECARLFPVLEELAKSMANVKNLIIAKFDGTANEHPLIAVKNGYSTFRFFMKGENKKQIEFNEVKDLEGFISWIKEKMGEDLTEALPFDAEL